MNMPGLSTLEHLGIVEAMNGYSLFAIITIISILSKSWSIVGLESKIAFQFASSELHEASYPSLDRFASILQKHPCLHVKFEGHCGEAFLHLSVLSL